MLSALSPESGRRKESNIRVPACTLSGATDARGWDSANALMLMLIESSVSQSHSFKSMQKVSKDISEVHSAHGCIDRYSAKSSHTYDVLQ